MDLAELEAKLAEAESPEELREIELQVAILGGQVVGTLAEVAELFGVGVSTCWLWRSYSDPMPGCEGAWKIREIHEWRERRKKLRGGGNEKSAEQAALELVSLRTAVELLDVKYQGLAGDLVSRAAVARQLPVMLAEVEAVLEPIEDLMACSAPEFQREAIRLDVRQNVESIVMHLRSRFEELGKSLDGK